MTNERDRRPDALLWMQIQAGAYGRKLEIKSFGTLSPSKVATASTMPSRRLSCTGLS
jgi:hypothetical protein